MKVNFCAAMTVNLDLDAEMLRPACLSAVGADNNTTTEPLAVALGASGASGTQTLMQWISNHTSVSCGPLMRYFD